MKSICLIVLMLLTATMAIAQSTLNNNCQITFVNNTDYTFTLFTKNHTFQIHPQAKMKGKTDCADLQEDRRALKENSMPAGYKVNGSFSSNQGTIILSGAPIASCKTGGCSDPHQTRIQLDSHNSVCVPCLGQK